MRFTFCVATIAVCLIALQCTASSPSEGDDDHPPSSPQPPSSGEHSDPGTVGGKQVSGGPGGPGTSQSDVGQEAPPGSPSTAAASVSSGEGHDNEGHGDKGDGNKGQKVAPGGGADNPNGSLSGSSGSVSGLAGGAPDKTVTTTTTSTAANADAGNLLTAADQRQRSPGTAQHDAAQGIEKKTIHGSEQTHNNPSGALPIKPETVITTTTKPVPQLGDTGRETEDRDRVPDKEHTHQAGPPTTVSTTKEAPKQITSTPSRNTVEGKQQHNGRQPSTTPDEGTPVVKGTNAASSSEEQVHALELPLEPHTDKGVSKDLTKTQQAQEQSPPLSVQPQTPQSTTTVKEKITPLVHTTSSTRGISKDVPQNNNPPTTSTAGELKVPAKSPAETTTTVPTKGEKETVPAKLSVTSTSEPAKVESTAHLTPLPKLPDALQSLDNKDNSISSSLHFALAALATLVVMAVAPAF